MGGGVNDGPLLIINAASPVPPYEQIASQIRMRIATGRLGPGAPLPSVRQLARDLDLAPNTVARGYGELERAGWVVTHARKGVTVAPKPPRLAPGDRRRELAQAVGQLLVTAHQLGLSAAELHAEIDRQIGLMGGAATTTS